MADNNENNPKDIADAIATMVNNVIALNQAKLISEENLTKGNKILGTFLDKVEAAVDMLDFTKTKDISEQPAIQTKENQQNAHQQNNNEPAPAIVQPIVENTAAIAATPAAEQTFFGYTLSQLKAQNVGILKDIATSLSSEPNASKNIPIQNLMYESEYKDKLIQYICDNAHFATK